MKSEESAKHYQTLCSWVGSGHTRLHLQCWLAVHKHRLTQFCDSKYLALYSLCGLPLDLSVLTKGISMTTVFNCCIKLQYISQVWKEKLKQWPLWLFIYSFMHSFIHSFICSFCTIHDAWLPIPETSKMAEDTARLSSMIRARCSVCRRIMPVTRAGLVCVHGPVGHRCSGSRLPPAPSGSFSLPPTTSPTAPLLSAVPTSPPRTKHQSYLPYLALCTW